jgi:hypothetical protein
MSLVFLFSRILEMPFKSKCALPVRSGSPRGQVLYFDNLTSSTGLQGMVKKRKGNFGHAHDFMLFSQPPPLFLDDGRSA